MNKKYHVILKDSGWIIKGSTDKKIYKTKPEALTVAKKIASGKNASVAGHSKDDKVTSVSISKEGRMIQTANVKHRLDQKTVRNSIAEINYKENQKKQSQE